MTFAIPKSLKQVNSLMTPTVLEVELNDTDVDRMMTHVLELAVKYGRRSGSSTDTRDFDGYLAKLVGNGALRKVEGDEAVGVLEGWIKASVLKMERGGLKRGFEQMGYLRPLTIAAYRSGLPKSASRNRKADSLTYRSMARVLTKQSVPNPAARIQGLFLDTFGRGVTVRTGDWITPEYDGTTDLDIDTLLALRFLEGFDGHRRETREKGELDPPVPIAVDPLGQDVLDYLALYGPLVPVGEAFAQVSALVSLRLFQLPLVSARVVRTLLSQEPSTVVGNPSEIYCDFVRERGCASDELSRMCVQRDLEVLRAFFGDRLLMRSLDEATTLLPGEVDLGADAAERLMKLAALRDEPTMQMALRMKLHEIEVALGDGDDEARGLIRELRDGGISPAEQLKAVLVEGLRRRGLENQVKWFWSTGGLTNGPTTKPYALLSGTLRSRSTWRYAPTDECITALLCLCFVEGGGTRTTSRLPIRTVLDRLHERFGLLIDRPPGDLDSADTRAGASENLTAFTRQLQLLGCFQGLSDDLNAQFVTRPRGAVQ